MKYKIQNLKTDRQIGLGTKNGKMLSFAPGQVKVISEDVMNLFNFEINNAVSGKFLVILGEEKEELSDKSKDRIKDFSDDLKDDGKRNYSNRKKTVVTNKNKKTLRE